jgi:hypothetical protein
MEVIYMDKKVHTCLLRDEEVVQPATITCEHCEKEPAEPGDFLCMDCIRLMLEDMAQEG